MNISFEFFITILTVILGGWAGHLNWEIKNLRNNLGKVDNKHNDEIQKIKIKSTSTQEIKELLQDSKEEILKDIKIISSEITVDLKYLKKDMIRLEESLLKLEAS